VIIPRARLGGVEAFLLDEGTFRLDGGAMFRVVPRVLWEKRCPPDDRNRILLAMRPVLVRAEDGSWVLIESGIGARRRDPKFREIFDVREGPGIEAGLAELGVKAEEISKVVVSHMHFDHIGGLVTVDRQARFPNARLVVQKGELSDAHAPCDLCKASYVEEDWKLLREKERVDVVDGAAEIAPGVRVHVTGGHTIAHQVVEFGSGSEKGIFFGDLVPTAAHLKPHFVMAYDLYPVACFEAKREWVERVVQEKWLTVFYHDPVSPFGRVVKDGKDYRVEAIA
jgi:glyoxylase-like metal-dependent hydrolase (beta-lactamase superfamily II)